MSKIRVLILFHHMELGGMEKIAHDLCLSLNQTTFAEAAIFSIKSPSSKVQEWLGASLINLSGTSKVKRAAQLLLISQKYDIIMPVSPSNAISYAVLIGLINKKRIISWIHSDFKQQLKCHHPIKRIIYKAWYQFLLSFISEVVFVSKGVKEAYLETFNYRKSYRIIYNFVNLPKETPLPYEYHPLFSKPVVLSIGRLVSYKKMSRLISIHAMLVKHDIGHNLIILGDGEEYELLSNQIKQLQVSDSCFLLGFQGPAPFLQKATCYASLSEIEGFGLTLAEAQSYGVPILSLDCPSGPAEILDNGKAGFLLPLDSSDEVIFESLKTLLTDTSLQEQYRKAGLIRSSEFLPEKVIKDWELFLTK